MRLLDILGILTAMDREIEDKNSSSAMERINAALNRIEAAADAISKQTSQSGHEKNGGASSARITALVNQHEAMREEVAGTLRDLDSLIEGLES